VIRYRRFKILTIETQTVVPPGYVSDSDNEEQPDIAVPGTSQNLMKVTSQEKPNEVKSKKKVVKKKTMLGVRIREYAPRYLKGV
jgi:hypothetical protein